MNQKNNLSPCPFCCEDIDFSMPECPCCGESLRCDRLKLCPYCAELIPVKVKDICPFCDSPQVTPAVEAKRSKKIAVLDRVKFPVVTVLLILICCALWFNSFWRSYKEVWLPQHTAQMKAAGKTGTSSPPEVTTLIFRTNESKVIFDQGGLTRDSVVKEHDYHRLFTSLFLHFSLLHLLCNMYVLFSAGKCVENLFGWWRFAGIFLLSGIGGGVATLLWSEKFICAGASGAVFGLIGAILGYLLRHHRNLSKAARNKLYGSVAWFFVVNTVAALSFNALSGGMKIGIEAHTGGFVVGIVTGMILSSKVCRQEDLSAFAEDL
ncbi:MAG: rhomboid family intramembrane serine protease [Lentisphaeria bacterium]|nr:rhomboid family intramembrane serine protease [Lentisphaeria bacterium]